MSVEFKYNVPVNLRGLELRNAKFQSLAAAPTAAEALFFYDSVEKTVKFHNGTEWVPMDARLRTDIPLASLAVDPLARANHTGTQLAATISDFDTAVRSSRLDQMAAPTASVSFNAQRLTNVATPVDGTDAVNKDYVDAQIAGGNAETATALETARDFSLSGVVTAPAVSFDGTGNVVLATSIADGALTIAKTDGLQAALDSKQASLGYTPIDKAGDTGIGNLTMAGTLTLAGDPTADLHAATKRYVDLTSQRAAMGLDPKDAVLVATDVDNSLTGLQTIQGVELADGDSVLVKSNTNPVTNGIYRARAGAWERRADALDGTLTHGALVLVTKGTYAGQQWYLTTNDPVDVDSDNLVWVHFNGVTPYQPGDGLEIGATSYEFKVKAGTGIVVNSSGVHIDETFVARKASALIGNTIDTQFDVIHNLNNLDVIVQLRHVASGDVEYASIRALNANTTRISFGFAPTQDEYRVSFIG